MATASRRTPQSAAFDLASPDVSGLDETMAVVLTRRASDHSVRARKRESEVPEQVGGERLVRKLRGAERSDLPSAKGAPGCSPGQRPGFEVEKVDPA